MNSNQNNGLFISSIIVFIIGILILILGIFTMHINYTVYPGGTFAYETNLYSRDIDLIISISIPVLGTGIFVSSLLLNKHQKRDNKTFMVLLGLANIVYAILAVLFLILQSIENGAYNTALGVIVYILLVFLVLGSICSSIFAFKYRFVPQKLKNTNETTSEIFAKLRSLKELLDKGIITDEEFELKKKAYINKIS